ASSGNAKAVLPVHLGGQSADMAAIAKIAKRHGMIVIEDACHALGTTLDDGVVGDCQHSAMAAFSFHPVKTIAMGEGGAVTTNDPVLYEKLTRLRNHGMTRDPQRFSNDDLAFGDDGSPNPWYYEMPEVGFNYRASDIHCALGLSQLRKLDAFVSARRLLADTYDRLLAPFAPYVLPPHRVDGCDPGWHLYAARMNFTGLEIPREQVISRLKAAGVGTQVHYIPVHTQPYYQNMVGQQQLPGAMAYYRATLSLPLFPSMTIADVERVAKTIEEVIRSGPKK
ncbi:MAG: DegT/DnrJ/EryC1/StrS family aminotransferase, partial [Afipia sp.]